MFSKAGFKLHKWNSSERSVIEQIDPDLRDARDTHLIGVPTKVYYGRRLMMTYSK